MKRVVITAFSGDALVLRCAVRDAAGAVVSLAGLSPLWRLAVSVDATPLVSKSVGGGIVVTDSAAGLFEVAIDGADTEALAGDYYHEAALVDGAGGKSTVAYGRMTIQPNLIRLS